MIQIQFGEFLLEADLVKMDLEDLMHSKANEISTLILNSIKDKIIEEMRTNIGIGDVNGANDKNGYLKAIEDFEEFFKVHIPEALKSELAE